MNYGTACLPARDGWGWLPCATWPDGVGGGVKVYGASSAPEQSEVFMGINPEMADGLEGVAAELAKGDVLYAALAGAGSPIPWGQASRATVELSPRVSLTVLGDAGHFPWIECPGSVGAALRRLVTEVSELAAHRP